jgi:general stress protein YciG
MSRPDTRTYITVHDGMPDHPKVMPLSDTAFRLLVTGWCWCSRYLTDGVMPMEVWSRFGNKRGRDELVRTAHVHLTDDGQSVSFHDYLDHQRSRAQVEDLRKKRAEAGRKGGKAGSKVEASASPSDPDVAKQNESIVRDIDIDIEEKLSSEADATDPEPHREDVEKLCHHLRDRIVGNGSKEPAIGKKWLDAARLMLDRDGRTFDQIMTAIDWCQDDEFWRSNILSMPTVREKYETLRLQAKSAKPKPQAIVGGGRPSWEQ